MKDSFLLHSKTIIIDLKAEQLFANLVENKAVEQNIYLVNTIKSECIQDIVRRVKEVSSDDYSNVVIDFHGIENSHNLVFEFQTLIDYLKDSNKNIYCIKIANKLYGEQLKFDRLDKTKEVIQELDSVVVDDKNEKREFYFFSIENCPTEKLELEKTVDIKFELFSNCIFDKLKNNRDYFGDKKDKLSNSSDVYLNKYVNIKAFIEERNFSNYGLFLLAEKISEHIPCEKINDHTLFTMSNNGSYLATLLSKIIGIELAYLDHLGPINKIYKTHLDFRIHSNRKYILVSDVICLGTETKIAESIINYENSIVVGSATIVNIKTTVRKERYPIYSLFEINKATNEYLKYSIETELSNHEK